MRNILEHEGILQAVLQDYVDHKLPNIIRIRAYVECSECLSETDLQFLKDLYHEVYQYEEFVDQHDEFRQMFNDFANVYKYIMDLALENEKSRETDQY